VFSGRRNHKNNPVILLSSHAIAQEEVEVRHGNNPQIKPRIITSYNRSMGSIDSSDMILYTHLAEGQTMGYWKKVVFNNISRMVLNRYILYKENYKKPDKLKSRHKYTVSIIEIWGRSGLTMPKQMILRDHEDSEKSLKR
jgi:hypothetical protein